MKKEDGEVLFNKMTRSERSLDSDELISLINATTASRQALQRLTSNILRNDLARLEKNRLVKVKQTSALSATAPQKFYYSQKFNLKNAKSVDLISYAVYALRHYIKIGRVNIKENGNALADAVISKEDGLYSNLEFISLDVTTYERKLQQITDKSTQKVLIANGASLQSNITKNYRDILNDAILIIVNDKEITLTYRAAELISDSFDFKKLKTSKSMQIVDSIEENYEKAEHARLNSRLKNVNKHKEG